MNPLLVAATSQFVREEARGGGRHSKMLAASVSVFLLLAIQYATAGAEPPAGSRAASGSGLRSSKAVEKGPMIDVHGPAEGHRVSADEIFSASGASKGKRVVAVVPCWGFIFSGLSS